MSITHILFQILIEPLKLCFELIYSLSFDFIGDSAIAIIPLSLAVNLLCLPLYQRAEAIRSKNRIMEKKMEPWLNHIKAHFRGDERFMMTQAYYKICNYKPAFALRNSISLFLQIPFFIAAYQVISNEPYLKGKSFGPIADLSVPDGLLTVGTITINVLPIIMTVINLVSSTIYSKNGKEKKEIIQQLIIALVFLILLYNSASGLVVYWIFNQLFSLCKNVLNQSEHQGFIVRTTTSLTGIFVLTLFVFLATQAKSVEIGLLILGLILELPLLRYLTRKNGIQNKIYEDNKGSLLFFWVGGLFLTVLVGLLIPSAVIRSSPSEFVIPSNYQSPLNYILNSYLTALGFFVFWCGVFYYIAGNHGKYVISKTIWFLSGISILDYMCFGTDFGMLTPELRYQTTPVFSISAELFNLIVIISLVIFLLLLWKKAKKIVKSILTIALIVVSGMSAINIFGINTEIPQIKRALESSSDDLPTLSISKNGKNVIVLMMDRAISSYVPYLFQERPELQEKFAGFTYYPNTISYGNGTNTGSPALYGGYEYRPEELNSRDNISLKEKQNEALKVMPVLFEKNGYTVTVCEPSYAGYSDIPDLSIYDAYPEIKTYNTEQGQVLNQLDSTIETKIRIWERNFFCYGMMKIAPLVLQPSLYQNGSYFSQDIVGGIYQVSFGLSEANGIDNTFLNCYAVLDELPDMTNIEENTAGSFLMLCNHTTHTPTLLAEPDYIPAMSVNNTDYDRIHSERFTYKGRSMRVNSLQHMASYQVNMAALIKLGEWFDYLQSQGVYNNTRIIIVSDHGYCLRQFDDMVFGDNIYEDAMWYNAFLMVKDFDESGEWKTDNSFMTNADTPTLAFDGLIENPINPSTGNIINNEAKKESEHHIFHTVKWQVNRNNGNTFLPGHWFSLHGDNLFDMSKWESLGIY